MHQPTTFRSTRFLIFILVLTNLVSVLALTGAAHEALTQIGQTEALEIYRGVGQLEPAYELEVAEKQESIVMHGFLLDGDPRYLDAWEANQRRTQAALDTLGRLRHDRWEARELAKLAALDQEDERAKDHIVALWRAGRQAEARRYFNEVGLPLKARLARQFDAILDKQRDDLNAQHADVLAVERASMKRILALAVVLPVIVLLMAAIVHWRIVVPLRGLEAASRAIARGELAVRVPCRRLDEIGCVAAAFNQMAAAVEGALASLSATNAALRNQDRYKDEFLGVVSHELRTPVNYVKGFAGLLAEPSTGPLNAAQRQHVADIDAAADRMLRMVNDLLDTAALQAGKLKFELSEVDFAALAADAVQQLGPLARSRGVELVADVTVPRWVRLDPHRIHQVLANLVGNAIKFTPAGGSVRLEARVDDDHLVATVRDTGIGIAEHDLPALFKRFGQLNMSKTRRSGGSGLGLWISKGIVEAHGGTIEVRSQPQAGSAFSFRLPLEA